MDDIGARKRPEVAERAGQSIFHRLGDAEGAAFADPVTQRLTMAEEMRDIAIGLRVDRVGRAHRAGEQGHVRTRPGQRRAEAVVIAPGKERGIKHRDLHRRTNRRSETACRAAASSSVSA